MPALKIQPLTRTIKKVLAGPEYYLIPRFQRPYSWDGNNLEEFWNDTVVLGEAGYFIGPMVGYETKADIGIVDGQQRLTTVTVLLAALRDEFSRLAELHPGAKFDDLAAGLHASIERPDDNNDLRFVLAHENGSATYLRNAIQAFPDKSPSDLHEPGARNLSEAMRFFETKVRELSENAYGAVAQESKKRNAVKKALLEVRDQILGLQVIWVGLESVDDAYLIFETLNSRGMDLEVADLVKNLLLSRLRSKTKSSVDTYRDRWDAMRKGLEQGTGSIAFNRFLLHWWLSRHPYVAERRLYTKIRPYVTKERAPEILAELEQDATIYRRVVRPDTQKWKREEADVERSLLALQMFNVRQPAPLLLALLRQRTAGNLTSKALINHLGLIENYHYIYTAVTGLSSSGGVSEMYAKTARDVSAAENTNEVGVAMAALRTKLRARVPTLEVFESAFVSGLDYSNDDTTNRRVVEYTLCRLMLHGVSAPLPIDWRQCTIEHIASQADAGELMPSIGNLLLVPEDLNGKMGSKSFAQKKKLLGPYKDQLAIADVLAESDWDTAEIEARSKALAATAYNAIWKV